MKRVLVWLIALPLAAVAGLWFFAWWRDRGFLGDHPPPGKMLGTPRERVHAIDRIGAEPTVVFIHGNPGTCLDFVPVMEKLSPRVHTVALDRPGYGWSRRPEALMTPTEQARFLHAAVKELNLVKPVIVGFSFGGPVAISYALEYPGEVSSLLLIAAVASPDEGHTMSEGQAALTKPFGSLIAWTVGPILSPDVVSDGYVDAFYPQAPDAETVERGRIQFTRPTTLLAAARDWQVLTTELPKLASRYGELDLPVEILQGNQDRIVSPKHAAYLVQHIKGAHRVDVDDCGHQMMSTHTDAVVEGVLRAISRIKPP